MGLSKEDEMVKRTKMAKIQLTKGKSENGSGNDEAFGEVSKMYAERYNKGDHRAPLGLTKEGDNGGKGKNGKNPFFQVKIRRWD